MRFVLIFIFVALPCLDTYGITKVYNIIDRKLKIHTYEPLTVDQKKKIGKKIDQILDVLNEYNNFDLEVDIFIHTNKKSVKNLRKLTILEKIEKIEKLKKVPEKKKK